MKRINEIDPFVLGRSPLSEQEREKRRLAKRQQRKEDGYQYLTELYSIGEYDAAKQLANQNYNWGYEVIDGVVVERFD